MNMKTARRRLLTFSAGLASAALAFSLTAAPAGAVVEVSPLDPVAKKVPAGYVGLGDSYAAGTGGGPIVPDPFPDPIPECLQTAKAYPTLLGGTNLGCFGATTGGVATIALASSALLATANEVTITVGGNDVGAGAVAAACTADPAGVACATALGAVEQALPLLPQAIEEMMVPVRWAAPNADIVITGYPRLFTITSTTPEPLRTLATTINGMTDKLNTRIREGAAQSGVPYVDVASRFNGHGIGSDTPWINYVPGVLNQDTFHPNAAGYTNGYRPAVNAAVKR